MIQVPALFNIPLAMTAIAAESRGEITGGSDVFRSEARSQEAVEMRSGTG
jgi:hypothetical protein